MKADVWKCQKCGSKFTTRPHYYPRKCPHCNDRGAKTFFGETTLPKQRKTKEGARLMATNEEVKAAAERLRKDGPVPVATCACSAEPSASPRPNRNPNHEGDPPMNELTTERLASLADLDAPTDLAAYEGIVAFLAPSAPEAAS